ncbi:hypothetical protein [Aeromonas phage Akh-2]|nr:hypothetical protein [Aeromonas phage Akh-2]
MRSRFLKPASANCWSSNYLTGRCYKNELTSSKGMLSYRAVSLAEQPFYR